MTSAPSLPPPGELERICRGLATLDAILCPEWEHRYFSFNAAWAAGERMASMRNGEGDDWFFVFGDAGVFLKSFWHEHQPRLDPAVIYAGLPAALEPQLAEAAFSMAQVTFGGWHDDGRWTLRGAVAPMEDGLPILAGDPAAYQAYAASYFELDVALDDVAHVLAGLPLDDERCARLRPGCSLAELAADLAEIGYGAEPPAP